MSKLESTMFREYDIRGEVSKQQLNNESVELIARGFAAFLAKRSIKKCVLGFDSRSYSEGLKDAFAKGLISSGVEVIDLGMVITPMMYFAQYHYKCKGGAMVTASHNPNGWSGLKLGYDYSVTLLPKDIKELYSIIEKEEFVSGNGSIQKEDVLSAYTKDLTGRVKLEKKLKVLLDCGNGTAGSIAPAVLRAAGIEVVEQFCDLDSSFPNHEPNPSLVEAMDAVAKGVKENKADLGLAMDGDGDRLGFCDEQGSVIWADQALVLLSRLILKQYPGSSIVYDVKCTAALDEDIRAHGGKPVMWKTGHSYIKEKVAAIDAALGGEKSGHMFFNRGYYGFDDAVFAALKLIEYLSNSDKTFSQEMASLPKFITSPTLHVACADSVKYEVEKKLVADFKQEFGEDRVIDINGARVSFPDGWGLVRASSNMPVLVLVFEAKTEEGVEKIKNIFKEKFAKYPEIGKTWKSG